MAQSQQIPSPDKIYGFVGPYRFLSNFWPAIVMLDGVAYPSVENAYQASKTILLSSRVQFQGCEPSTAKRLGRLVQLRFRLAGSKAADYVRSSPAEIQPSLSRATHQAIINR